MDSTTVRLVVDAAERLGMTGAQAFGWYLAVEVVGKLIVAGVVVYGLTVARGVVQFAMRASRIYAAIREADRPANPWDYDVSDVGINKAAALIRKHWND